MHNAWGDATHIKWQCGRSNVGSFMVICPSGVFWFTCSKIGLSFANLDPQINVPFSLKCFMEFGINHYVLVDAKSVPRFGNGVQETC